MSALVPKREIKPVFLLSTASVGTAWQAWSSTHTFATTQDCTPLHTIAIDHLHTIAIDHLHIHSFPRLVVMPHLFWFSFLILIFFSVPSEGEIIVQPNSTTNQTGMYEAHVGLHLVDCCANELLNALPHHTCSCMPHSIISPFGWRCVDCQCFRQMLVHTPEQRVITCSSDGCFATVDDGTAGWSSTTLCSVSVVLILCLCAIVCAPGFEHHQYLNYCFGCGE